MQGKSALFRNWLSVRRAKLTYLRKRLGKGATLVNEKQEKAVAAPAK
jgi:ribosomal protein L19